MAKSRIWVRGMGELGSSVAHLLHRLDYRVFGSELEQPLSIRRPVCFSEAVNRNETVVAGVEARLVPYDSLLDGMSPEFLPVVLDNRAECLKLKPEIYVDARMLKKPGADSRSWAQLSIGLGPGFTAGTDCHVVIETKRGHDLGRVILDGTAQANTGVPGQLGGKSSERVIRSPGTGPISWQVDFGEEVGIGQLLGTLPAGTPVKAMISGIVRGLIDPGVGVKPNMKIGDVDPRGDEVDFRQISEKARLVAYGVLEAILIQSKDNVDG